MTLRTKLALALAFTALLPMGVAVGLPMLQAERRAQEEASRRLEATLRQTAILIERQREDAVARVEQVAAELRENRSALQPLLQGPAAEARSITRSLAERHGLDHLEFRNRRGAVLAISRSGVDEEDGAALTSIDPIGENGAELLPFSSSGDPSGSRVAYYARRTIRLGSDALTLIGGREVGHAFITGISEISGQPASLIDGSGRVVESSERTYERGPRITEDVGLGHDGWRIRVSVAAGDAREVRRELFVAFAGVAPFAIASAVVVGTLLAAGISRPVRALAGRAESIAAERAGGPLSLIHDRNEVRRLGLSFEQMLAALSQSERQRGAAERIAAWQDVARRIAHEVKNPLSPIKVAVENMRRTRQKAPEQLDQSLDVETSAILEEVESLRRLVEEFSLFARLPKPNPVSCDLRQTVHQTLALFASRIDSSKVRVDLGDEGFPDRVIADPEQIGRALKNILANALDSMDAMGPEADRRLALTLRRIVSVRGGSRTPFAEIEIRDTGVGLDADAQRRIFEPYFTTRSERGGTGLGMAIAYRIVTDHGGHIQATGSPGHGAKITIRLPLLDAPRETTGDRA
jgi:signal transduction histidine kinase